MTQQWYRVRTLGSLGEALAGIREAARVNQATAAAAVGASRSTVSRVERGVPVSTEVALALAATAGYEFLVVPRGSRVVVEQPQ